MYPCRGRNDKGNKALIAIDWLGVIIILFNNGLYPLPGLRQHRFRMIDDAGNGGDRNAGFLCQLADIHKRPPLIFFSSVTYFVVTRKLYFIYTCEQGAQQIRSLVNEVVGGKCSQNPYVAPVSGSKAVTFDPCLQTRV